MAKIRILAAVGAAALLGSLAQSARASDDSYKFLESVKKADYAQVSKTLSQNPGLVNTHDLSDGHTALMIATTRLDAPWMQYLIALHADVNGHDDAGVTPLIVAVRAGFDEGAKVLVENGARANISDRTGETPLITAVHNRNLAMMRVLLAAGADPDRADNSGRSARDYVKLAGSTTMADVLANTVRPKAVTGGATYGPHR